MDALIEVTVLVPALALRCSGQATLRGLPAAVAGPLCRPHGPAR
jgi:hypothetical protein